MAKVKVLDPKKAEEQLQEYNQALVPEVKEQPKGLEPIDPVEAADLFFLKPDELRGEQRAVPDRTAYGAPVVHVF